MAMAKGVFEGESQDEHAGVSHHVDLTVVGRMAPTGTPWDAAIIVPVEQVWRVHGLPTGHAPGEERIGPPFDPAHLPGVPAVVVKPDTVPTAYGLRSAYRGEDATAFFPAEVLVQLYAVLGDVRSVLDVMALTTQLLVIAAIMAGLMGLIQLQRERFAVLRALGAPRSYIFLVVWTGITAMVAAGAMLGLGLGYAVAHVLSLVISERTGVAVSATIGRPEAHARRAACRARRPCGAGSRRARSPAAGGRAAAGLTAGSGGSRHRRFSDRLAASADMTPLGRDVGQGGCQFWRQCNRSARPF